MTLVRVLNCCRERYAKFGGDILFCFLAMGKSGVSAIGARVNTIVSLCGDASFCNE